MTVVRFGLLRRRPELDQAAFHRHWTEIHAPLVRTVPGMRHYAQNEIVDRTQRVPRPRAPVECDGFSQIWFDSLEGMVAAMATPEQATCQDDVRTFLRSVQAVVTEPCEVVPIDRGRGPLIKRMSIVAKLRDIDDATFRRRWVEEHGPMRRDFPGIRGYRLNPVIDRSQQLAPDVRGEGISVDGIAEAWFDSVAAMEAAFATPAGQAAMADAARFARAATTFLVEERLIF